MPSPIAHLGDIDRDAIHAIDEILGPGFVQRHAVPAGRITPYNGTKELAVWCKMAGLHQIVTDELVAFLRDIIGGDSALEICAGRGVLGHALGLRRTDSYLAQTVPAVHAYYESIGERTTALPPEVERLEAYEAVRKHKPAVVVGAWVTHKGHKDGDGSPYGVNEKRLFDRHCVKKYVVVGNEATHGDKPLLRRLTHRAWYAPWLVTRSLQPDKNVIYVWDKHAGL